MKRITKAAVLAASLLAYAGWDAGRFYGEHKREQRAIEEDPIHLHDPQRGFRDAYLDSWRATVDSGVEKRNSRRSGIERLARINVLDTRNPEIIEDLKKDILCGYTWPVVEAELRALVRLGEKQFLYRLVADPKGSGAGIRTSMEAVKVLKEVDPRLAVKAIVRRGVRSDSDNAFTRSLIEVGNEDAFRYLMRSKNPDTLVLFVNTNPQKPFLWKYKDRAFDAIVGKLKYPSGRFRCEQQPDYLKNYISAMQNLDPNRFSLIQTYASEDCGAYWFAHTTVYDMMGSIMGTRRR